jgi:hypothetical protein
MGTAATADRLVVCVRDQMAATNYNAARQKIIADTRGHCSAESFAALAELRMTELFHCEWNRRTLCHCEAQCAEAIPCLTSRGTLARPGIALALCAWQ